MRASRVFLALVLACGAQFGADDAMADPRAAQSAGMEAAPTVADDVWLRRLVGSYKVEGLVQAVAKGDCAPLPPDPGQQASTSEAPPEPYCRTIQGKGDCVSIGPGPGVHCIVNFLWQDMYEVIYPTEAGTEPSGVFELPGGVSYLDPAMLLFGLDPPKLAVHHLLVDQKGMPEGGAGSVTGNRARFRTTCVNAPTLLGAMKPGSVNGRVPTTCNRITVFEARPDSRVLFLTMDIEINDDVFTRLSLTLRRQAAEDGKAKP